MPNEFQYDVFLSHNAKDKAVVRDVTSSGTPRSRRGNEAQSSAHQPSTKPPEPPHVGCYSSASGSPHCSVKRRGP